MFAKLGRGLSRRSGNPAFQLAMFMVLAFILRVATFGHPYLHIDETFYFLVGEEMHKGAVPYVDIWDRKPFGLFLIYYLIVGVWDNVIAYQIAATLFAGATAWVICRIASLWGGAQGGWFAGALYLLFLGPLYGFGGQAPVFYNLLIASAALLLLGSAAQLREGHVPAAVWSAMALCGLALTIKQSTLFEAAFFGLYAATLLLKSACPKPRAATLIAGFMLIGAAPMALISACYAIAGYWPEYWQAMVTSNIVRLRPSAFFTWISLVVSISRIVILIGVALVGCIKSHTSFNQESQRFALLWITTGFASLISTPELGILHFLPLLVPLCAASGFVLGLRPIGWLAMGIACAFPFSWNKPWDFDRTHKARLAIASLTKAITEHGGERGLFVFGGPMVLYTQTGLRPLSPLAFTGHLGDPADQNVSHLETVPEVNRVLRMRPGVVVTFTFASATRHIAASNQAVFAYVRENCKLVDVVQYYQFRTPALANVYGDCRPKVRPAY